MLGADYHPATYPSPIAVGLRVANVRRAAEFYQGIGFTFVMAVPDETEEWLLCLLRYGSGSILLGTLDHPRFPRTRRQPHGRAGPRALDVRIDLTVPDLAATYDACAAAGCQITEEPAEQPWGARTFSCVDPFGYEWRFTEKTERTTYDPVARAARCVWS
jgi:uncharacterized glyoxalase superfamily protein PhnB